MAEHEKGLKWWLRYIVVPLISGGGIITLLIAIIKPFPSQSLRKVSLKGKVLDVDLPSWSPRPDVLGSIVFNKDSDIIRDRRLTAHLSVRDEEFELWKNSDPQVLLNLNPGEQLCTITSAAYNSEGRKFWLGFPAHCASSDACSYFITNNNRTLRATINNVEVILAPQGVPCPNS